MKQKLISLIRAAAVMAVVILAGFFGSEVSVILTESISIGDLIRYVAESGSIIIVLWIYCHYGLKQPLCSFDIGKPVCQLRWLVIGFLLPLVLNAFYLLAVPGTLRYQQPYLINLLNGIFSTLLYQGLLQALWQGIVYRGFLLKSLRQAWSTPVAILLIGAMLLPDIGRLSHTPTAILLGVLSAMLYNAMLCLVTLESGSIWCSVWIDALFRACFAKNLILSISAVEDPTMTGSMILWSYRLKSHNPLLIGAEYTTDTDPASALPAILCYTAVIVLALVWRKRPPSHSKGASVV